MAHKRADERLNNKKWPWQREGDNPDEEEDSEAEHYTNKELFHKFR